MGITSLNKFPRAVQEEIFSYLDVYSLNRCLYTCKDFEKIIKTSPELMKKIIQKLQEYVQQFFLINVKQSLSIPSFKRIYAWRNAHSKESDSSSSPHSLDEENVIRKTFEAICSPRDQNDILSSFKLFSNQQQTAIQKQEAIRRIAKSGGGLLLWYIAILEQDDRIAAALIWLQCTPQKKVNPLTLDDLRFGLQLVYCLTTHLSSEELEMFVKYGMKFNFEELHAFAQRFSKLCSPDVVTSLLNYEVIEANENAFQVLQDYIEENILDSNHDTQWLTGAALPSNLYSSPEYRFLRHGLKKKRFIEAFWTSQEMRSLINSGRKIEDTDLSKALLIGPNVGISGVVRVFVAVGALDPDSVDKTMQKLYKDNIHAKNEGHDHLTIDDGTTLQVLIETSGIELKKVKAYQNQINAIIQKNNGASSYGLREIQKVISNPEPFLKQHKLSKKFQMPLPLKGLIKLLSKNKPIPLKAHHLSYALKFHYPKQIIELMFKHQVPVEDIHLAVALQWGSSQEIIQLLMEKIRPQIDHLNCALQHQNPVQVIELFFSYWKQKNIRFEKYQLASVWAYARRWACDDTILELFQNSFEELTE